MIWLFVGIEKSMIIYDTKCPDIIIIIIITIIIIIIIIIIVLLKHTIH